MYMCMYVQLNQILLHSTPCFLFTCFKSKSQIYYYMHFLCLIKILLFMPILHINSSSHKKNSTDHGARSLAVSGSSRKSIRSENSDKCDIKSGCVAYHGRGLSSWRWGDKERDHTLLTSGLVLVEGLFYLYNVLLIWREGESQTAKNM